MLKEYTICLCFGREKCEQTTEEIAKRNNAIDWFIEPVLAPPVHHICRGPIAQQIAYKGIIIKEDC